MVASPQSCYGVLQHSCVEIPKGSPPSWLQVAMGVGQPHATSTETSLHRKTEPFTGVKQESPESAR